MNGNQKEEESRQEIEGRSQKIESRMGAVEELADLVMEGKVEEAYLTSRTFAALMGELVRRARC